MTPPLKPLRKPGRPPQATAATGLDAILDTALARIEAGEAVSFRALGAALGVSAMAVHHHVGDRAGLMRALSDRVFAALPARIGLVVIDTLARTMGDGDENTARDMGAFVRSLDHIRNATGAHIMVIHHSGKDASKGARGSGSLRAAVDTEIHLTRTGPVVMAKTSKQRDMPTGKVFAYVLRDVELGADEDGEPVTSAVIEPTEPVEQKPRLSAQQTIALQALDDALAAKGEKLHSDQFPRNRRCVSLGVWREYCDRHGLSDGQSDSAQRRAFHAVKKALHTKEIVRIFDDYVWRCDG